MSAKPGQPEKPSGLESTLLDESAEELRQKDRSNLGGSGTVAPSEDHATGEFVLSTPDAGAQAQPAAPSPPPARDELPSTIAATGFFLPGEIPSQRIDAPASANPAAVPPPPPPPPPSPPPRAPSKTLREAPRSDATIADSAEGLMPTLGATGVYDPGYGGATGEFRPEATQAFDPNMPVKRGQPAPDSTGVYVPGNTGAATNYEPGDRRSAADTEVMPATGEYGGTMAAPPDSPRTPHPSARKPAHPSDAQRCGRYVLSKFHAKGGMGEIWVAEDPEIGRSVALKRMLSHRPDQVYRFELEAQVTGQLEHPGIVPVHELGVNEHGQPFYAMKFVRGRTLQKVIEDFHSEANTAEDREVQQFRLLQIFLSLCQTVAYAHSRGVLHRDLKPENVMLGPYGETLLLDWGIAKVMGQPDVPGMDADASYVQIPEGSEETETRAGSIMGTPMYMAPEVAAGLNTEVDERSDIYLLGATLYEILSGRQPRRAKTAIEMIMKAQKEPPAPVSKLNPQVPRALEAICMKAMAHAKTDRYQSATDLADDVQRFIAGEPVAAYPEPFLARAWRWAKKHRKVLARSAAAVLLLAITISVSLYVRKLQLANLAAQKEIARKEAIAQAQRDLKEFRRLADEANFYAATTDQVSEHAPYFDPKKGETTAAEAFAIARKWGPELENLVLEDERGTAKKELYDLIVLIANVKSQQEQGAKAARDVLTSLDEADRLQAPSRSDYRLRAWAYHQLGDEAKAEEAKRKAEDPSTPASALDYFLAGDGLRKESLPKKGEPTDKRSWEPNTELMEQALAQYRNALRVDPNHYWSHYQIGRCDINLRRFAEAEQAVTTCIALKPESAWGYSLRSYALVFLGRSSEAEQDLDKAIYLSPDSRAPRLTRGTFYLTQKKYDQALADFDAVLQPPKEKQLIEAAFQRGTLYGLLGKKKEALADFDRVIQEDPDFKDAYKLRATLLIDDKKYEKALADIDRYVADGRSGERPAWEPHARRGWELRMIHSQIPLERRTGFGKEVAQLAVRELLAAVKAGGINGPVLNDLGAMFEHLGQINDAIGVYTEGLKRAPDDTRMRIKRAWAYELTGQRDKALEDFREAARLQPDNGEAHAGLGYLAALKKDGSLAQREAEMGLLFGAESYLDMHNVACIYGSLAESATGNQAAEYQRVALALIRRAIDVWKREKKDPSEIGLIKGEVAFKSLKDLPEFQKLLKDEEAATAPSGKP